MNRVCTEREILGRFPRLQLLDNQDVSFRCVPFQVREEIAKNFTSDYTWKLMAEKLGFSTKDIVFVEAFKTNRGVGMLNTFDYYIDKGANSLKRFRDALVALNYEDSLLELDNGWDLIAASAQEEFRRQHDQRIYPGEHAPCSYHQQHLQQNGHYPPKHYASLVGRCPTQPPSPPDQRHTSDPTALRDPQQTTHNSMPNGSSTETQYSMAKHNRVKAWLKNSPHPAENSTPKVKTPVQVLKHVKTFFGGKSTKPKVIKQEPVESSLATNSSGHQSMETSASSLDTPPIAMATVVKQEREEPQPPMGGSFYTRQGQPLLPSFKQAFSPPPPTLCPLPMPALPNGSPHIMQPCPAIVPQVLMTNQLAYPPSQANHVQVPAYNPAVCMPAAPANAEKNKAFPRKDINANVDTSPSDTVPYGNVWESMDTMDNADSIARQIHGQHGTNGHAGTGREHSAHVNHSNPRGLFLKGPDSHSQPLMRGPHTSPTGSLDSIKYSLSSEGKLESGPFTDNLRNVSVFVTHLYKFWGVHPREKYFSQCAVSLSKCLRDNNFRIQMDVPHTRRTPPWPSDSCWRDWIDRKFASVNYVLVCLSPTYLNVVNASHINDTDDIRDNIMSTRYIFHLMQHEFEENHNGNRRFIPILFDENIQSPHFPSFLQASERYRWPQDFEDLFFRLSQPERQVSSYLAQQQQLDR